MARISEPRSAARPSRSAAAAASRERRRRHRQPLRLPEFKALAPSSQAVRRAVLERFGREHGDKLIARHADEISARAARRDGADHREELAGRHPRADRDTRSRWS